MMPESKFELGVDLIPSDSLLSRMLASRKQDMNFLLEKNMDAIIAAAKKGRE